MRAPLKTSPKLQEAHANIRKAVAYYDHDRLFAPDIEAAKQLVAGAQFNAMVGKIVA